MTDLTGRPRSYDPDPLAASHTDKLTRQCLTLAADNPDLCDASTLDQLHASLAATTLRGKERALHAADTACAKHTQTVTQTRMREHNKLRAAAASGRGGRMPLRVARDRSQAFTNVYNLCYDYAAVVRKQVYDTWSYARRQASLVDEEVRRQRRRNDLTARRGGTPERIPDSGRTDYDTFGGYQQGRDRQQDWLARRSINDDWRNGGRQSWLDAAPDTAERDRRAWPHGGRCRACQRHIQAEYEWCSQDCYDSLTT